jgi:hypothetical protein
LIASESLSFFGGRSTNAVLIEGRLSSEKRQKELDQRGTQKEKEGKKRKEDGVCKGEKRHSLMIGGVRGVSKTKSGISETSQLFLMESFMNPGHSIS